MHNLLAFKQQPVENNFHDSDKLLLIDTDHFSTVILYPYVYTYTSMLEENIGTVNVQYNLLALIQPA